MNADKCCEYYNEEVYSCTKYQGDKLVYGGAHCRVCNATWHYDLELKKWIRNPVTNMQGKGEDE